VRNERRSTRLEQLAWKSCTSGAATSSAARVRRRYAASADSTSRWRRAKAGGSTTITSKRRPLAPQPGEHLERVAARGVVLARIDAAAAAVAFHVRDGRSDRRLRLIDAEHGACSAHGGMDPESAGAAEHVEHVAAAAVRCHQPSVVALVEEMAGLLSVEQVDPEPHAVFQEHDLVVERIAPHDATRVSGVGRDADGGGWERWCGCRVRDRARRAQDDPRWFEQVGGDRDHAVEVREPRSGVERDHHAGVVSVDDQAGQRVVLAVNQPVGGGASVGRELRAAFDSAGHARTQEVGVDGGRLAVVEDADSDR
jgi:hypothetical protein